MYFLLSFRQRIMTDRPAGEETRLLREEIGISRILNKGTTEARKGSDGKAAQLHRRHCSAQGERHAAAGTGGGQRGRGELQGKATKIRFSRVSSYSLPSNNTKPHCLQRGKMSANSNKQTKNQVCSYWGK